MNRLLLVVAVFGAACGRNPGPTNPPPAVLDATPDAAPARACATDVDCTTPWMPTFDGCGPVERCFAEQCIRPPAMTGDANPETGRVVFETAAGEHAFAVELVDDRFEITRGLMCRDFMQADWGMLFFMESTRVQRFWMKNTLIPLDMVFIAEDWTVAGVVAGAEPRTLSGRSVETPSRFVLELSGGAAARAGIVAGTKARFYAPSAPR